MSKKGFTVIELMIVVAIAGILLAVAIPAINRALHKNDPNFNLKFGDKVTVIEGFYKDCTGEVVAPEGFSYKVHLTECGIKTVDLTESIEKSKLKK